MAARKRTPHQREAQRVEINRRYLRGETQASIAVSLGLSREQITYDLRIIRERWLAATNTEKTEALAKELARIDHLEVTYWDSWEQSRRERSVSVAERTTGAHERTKSGVRREGRDGNPVFLAGVQWCIERRCRLLGLDAPERHEHTGADGQPISLQVKPIDYRLAVAALKPLDEPAEIAIGPVDHSPASGLDQVLGYGPQMGEDGDGRDGRLGGG